jgi:hypothetical protein
MTVLGLLGSDGLRAGARQGVCVLGIVTMEIHPDLKQAFQPLVSARLGRDLRVRARGMLPRRVRAASRLDEHVASWHAARLDDVFNRELCVTPSIEFSDDRALQGRSPAIDG